jgi:hypothetical protein
MQQPEASAPRPPSLLNEDGSASMATAFLCSHHAFRRDLGCFLRALAEPNSPDPAMLEALRQEWRWFSAALHGHHQMEDTRIFPSLLSDHPELAEALARLSVEHLRIDPLLAEGDKAFGDSLDLATARAVVQQLHGLLDAHLAFEEAQVVPHLREAREFPAPSNDEEVAMYAQGFAWSSQGVASEVLTKLDAMLPPTLRERLPPARAEFSARWQRAWPRERVGSAYTSVPDLA